MPYVIAQIEIAIIRKYVSAIEHLRVHGRDELKAYCVDLLDTAIEFGVLDTLGPIIVTRGRTIDPKEIALHKTVDHLNAINS